MVKLVDEFHNEMIEIYHQAKEKCNYTAIRFLQMVIDKGGVTAAKELLSSEKPQEGLTRLWECGQLDISMEALVLDPRFESLFTGEERRTAKERLEAYCWEG